MFKLSLGVTFIRHSEQIMHTNRLCLSMRFFVIPSDSRYSEGVLSFRRGLVIPSGARNPSFGKPRGDKNGAKGNIKAVTKFHKY